MSLANDREAFRAALAAVSGLTAYQYAPTSPAPLDVWPQLSSNGVNPQFPASAEWSVVLPLSQDIGEAETRLDTHITPVRNALAPVMSLTSIKPGRITVAGTELLAVEFIGRREFSFEE